MSREQLLLVDEIEACVAYYALKEQLKSKSFTSPTEEAPAKRLLLRLEKYLDNDSVDGLVSRGDVVPEK